jgi:hypothetical protein
MNKKFLMKKRFSDKKRFLIKRFPTNAKYSNDPVLKARISMVIKYTSTYHFKIGRPCPF